MAPRRKILIIDDERDIVKALTVRLQSKGYNTIVAFDGAQGIFMAHKEKPSLILLDIRMPAGDGFSVAEKLKESKRTNKIPIIFVTGSPERNAEERARELGVRYFIKKPYDPVELLDAVRRALEKKLPPGT
jgi:DNA-binding response OmpR family regulator